MRTVQIKQNNEPAIIHGYMRGNDQSLIVMHDQIIIQSKCGIHRFKTIPHNNLKDYIHSSIDSILEFMQCDHLNYPLYCPDTLMVSHAVAETFDQGAVGRVQMTFDYCRLTILHST